MSPEQVAMDIVNAFPDELRPGGTYARDKLKVIVGVAMCMARIGAIEEAIDTACAVGGSTTPDYRGKLAILLTIERDNLTKLGARP